MEFWGFTIETIGKIMVAFTVIAVHHRFLKEHQVDVKVFRAMKREQLIGILGIVFIVAGYFMQLPTKF